MGGEQPRRHLHANPTPSAPDTDWQDVIFRSAPSTTSSWASPAATTVAKRHSLRALRRRVPAEGVVLGSEFKRISLRGNLEQTVRPTPPRKQRAREPSAQQHGPGRKDDRTQARAQSARPSSTSDPDAAAGGRLVHVRISTSPRRSRRRRRLINIPNPVSQATEVQDKLGDTRLLANVFGEYEIFSGLSFRIQPRRRLLEPRPRHVLPAHHAPGLRPQRLREPRTTASSRAS